MLERVKKDTIATKIRSSEMETSLRSKHQIMDMELAKNNAIGGGSLQAAKLL